MGNQKSPGFNLVYGFQVFLSFAISVWLLYQVKHFYDTAHTESSGKVQVMLRSGDEILELGRSHMNIGRRGKLGEEMEKEADNSPKDTVHLRKSGEDEEGDDIDSEKTEDEEESIDIEDPIDEEDKEADGINEELETRASAPRKTSGVILRS